MLVTEQGASFQLDLVKMNNKRVIKLARVSDHGWTMMVNHVMWTILKPGSSHCSKHSPENNNILKLVWP